MESASSVTATFEVGRQSLRRIFLAVLSVSVFLFVASASGVRTPLAQADYCNPNGGGWSCFWSSVNLPPETRRWFEAGTTLRNWLDEEVADAYGGTVANKCANIKRGSDGAITQVACGSGQPFGAVPSTYRPGYVFIVHSAAGARTILGAALQ